MGGPTNGRSGHTADMSLLDEIVRDSYDNKSNVAGLLRKLNVVAARAGIEALEEWVDLELSGYGLGHALPAYRGPFDAGVQGHFRLPFVKNTPVLDIPPSSFPDDLRPKHLFEISIADSVSSLQELLEASGGKRELSIPWDSDTVRMVNRLMSTGKVSLYRDAWLINAWRPMTAGTLAGVIDAVRGRCMQLALELEKINPSAGEPGETITPTGMSIINNFFGGAQNVAQGTGVTFNVATIPPGDLAALVEAMRSFGVGGPEIQAFSDALAADEEEDPDLRTPGRRVLTWLANAATQTGAGASGGILTTLILRYFGIS